MRKLSFPSILCIVVIIISLLSMLGWCLKVSSLVQVSENLVPMQFNTALCLFMTALAIYILNKNKIFALVILAALFLLVGTTMLQYVVGANFGIDELFIKHYTKTLTEHPGRMSPNSGICFLLISLSAVAFNIKYNHKLFYEFGKANALAVGILSVVSLLSYLFHVDFLHSWGFVTGMALHTSLCFFLLSVALWKSQGIIFSKSYAALCSAALFSWFLFSWQYFTDRNDREISSTLAADVRLLSARIAGEINYKQKALDRLAHRSNWMSSLNYNILHDDIEKYFVDFPGLEFVSFVTEDQGRFFFFNNNIKTNQRTLYESVCASPVVKSSDKTLMCLKTPDDKMVAVFDLKTILNGFIDIPQLSYKTIKIKINGITLLDNNINGEPELDNWKVENIIKLHGGVWAVSVGLTASQLRNSRLLFPTFVFGLGAAVSLLLLFVFYYIRVVMTKNNKLINKESELREMVAYDLITHAPNRNSALKILDKAIASAKLSKNYVALMYIDIDDFKLINDSYGHDVGDKFLFKVYEKLCACSGPNVTIARFGGDEFVIILLSKRNNTKNIEKKALKLINAFQQGVCVNENAIFPTISVGLSVSIHGKIARDELIKQADTAMYAAKRQGKNSFAFYSKSTDEQMTKTAQIDRALHYCSPEYEDFYMCFQPQVLLSSEKVISFEALLRTNNKNLVGISPEEIIYRSEKNRTIVTLGLWTIEKSIDCWFEIAKATGKIDFDLSINISPVQLAEKNIVQSILKIIKNKKFNINKLVLEVTETAIIQNMAICLPNIISLKSYGVRFALDDFGKGYSSMNYLINIPADYVKIDKEFVMNLNTKNKVIVSTIIALASKLNMKVIAEGVEKKEHLRYLQSLHCAEGQGYYFSKPMPVDEVIKYLMRSK